MVLYGNIQDNIGFCILMLLSIRRYRINSGGNMNYKELIFKKLEQIENQTLLGKLYLFLVVIAQG